VGEGGTEGGTDGVGGSDVIRASGHENAGACGAKNVHSACICDNIDWQLPILYEARPYGCPPFHSTDLDGIEDMPANK